jgi:predicted aspartyl protease
LKPSPSPHRRAFLRRLLVLGAGAAGYLIVRRQLVWPTPKVIFAGGDRTGWMDLPTARGLIDLPAHVGWTRVRAVVDSGAQYSAIDAGLAERLALRAATPIPMVAFGVSGSPSLTRAVTVDADLGAFAVKGLRAATLDLQPLSGLTRQPFSLLLGRDFLGAVTAEVDFPRRRAAFFAPGAWAPPPEATAAPVRAQSGALTISVQIESAPPVEVMVDTGATGALALSEATAREAGLLDGRPLRTGPSVTLGGVSDDGMVLARRIRVAGHQLQDVEVQIYRPAANAPAPKGLLGLGVLQRFHLALDIAGGRLFLIGPEQPPPERPPTRLGG